ncbi:MAG: tRNA (adenosine(37)-N6)-dimethylallyltransferase MiaA [Bdellovibrio sp.]
MSLSKNVIIISGATATGKTSLSIALAKELKSKNYRPRIINFDSLLFYRELNIGTAKPDQVERSGIPHEMIDVISAKAPLNASSFVQMAEKIVDDCVAKNEVAILVGGSAFYLRALIKGMYESETTDEEVKLKVQKIIEELGTQGLIDFLKTHDPKSLDLYHANDRYRLSRAVEHFMQTGKKISEERERLDDLKPYDLSINNRNCWEMAHFYLDIDKDKHWKLIEKRSRKMIDAGLIDEVKGLIANGFNGSEKPLQSIGYKETFDFLAGKIASRDELLEKISISTRQLAKSQKTFFKKMIPKTVLNALDANSHLLKIISEEIK